jgi:hypothetical protein
MMFKMDRFEFIFRINNLMDDIDWKQKLLIYMVLISLRESMANVEKFINYHKKQRLRYIDIDID